MPKANHRFGAALVGACLFTLSSLPAAAQQATEWSRGSSINLGGLPGYTGSEAFGINNAGQVVGYSNVGGVPYATEWSGGSVINLGGLPGYMASIAKGINDAGQVVGGSYVGPADYLYATEWSRGAVIDLDPRPSLAYGINDRGQVVGYVAAGPVLAPGPIPGVGVFNLVVLIAVGVAAKARRRM